MAAQPPLLSVRDQAILRDLHRVRLLTGRHLERLHFYGFASANAAGSARRRTLARLQEFRLVSTLPRRVGGVRAGSAGLIYTLDARAYRQRSLWDGAAQSTGRVRRPWAIGWLFVAHTLDVAELYVRLRERQRRTGQRLRRFDAEPAAWYGTPSGVVKPDAYTVYEDGEWEHHVWLEVDRSTESLPTLQRKLQLYMKLAAAADRGPLGVLPEVLVTVRDHQRLRAVERLIDGLPDRPDHFISVARFDEVLTQAGRPPPN